NQPFGMAGVWERWITEEKSIDSCCIITIPANEILSNIHDRMPAIIPSEKYDTWLNSSLHDTGKLKHILVESKDLDLMSYYRVSTRVNKADNNDEYCIEKI